MNPYKENYNFRNNGVKHLIRFVVIFFIIIIIYKDSYAYFRGIFEKELNNFLYS